MAIVCAVLLWWNPTGILTPVRNILWRAVEPIAMFFQYSRMAISDMAGSVVHIGTLRKENTQLTAEVITLRSKMADLEDVQKENDQLRSEMGTALRRSDYLATALVVGYDSRGVGDWLLINKGSREGLMSGMAVVSGEGVLVGSIEEVLDSTSRVRLITHPKTVFNVHTVETQAKGVVRGKFGLGILFDSVLQTESIHSGDRVVTSEWGEQYPPGLFVGTVSEVGVSDDGLFQQATIVSPINFFDIRSVTVVR